MLNLPRPICEANPEWIRLYDIAWEAAFKNIEHPPGPGWLPQMSCIPGANCTWQWDSCFMALFAKYANGEIAPMNNLDNLYRFQRGDGYISMAYRIPDGEEAFTGRVNPPLYAWVEWEYYRFTGDAGRFGRVFPILKRYFHWLKENRRRRNGLYWFEDSGSSGMDNAPRGGYPAGHLAGSDICFVDLSSQQALSARCLALMAAHLGLDGEAAAFRREHVELAELVNRHHWCSRTGFYHDVFNRGDPEARLNFLASKTAAGFWPILAGVADDGQIKRLVGHLLNPDEFNTLHPVPALSRDDPNYDPLGGYWLGGVWAPINYMVARGLRDAGEPRLARDIAQKHLAAMAAVMDDFAYGGIWESYSPESFRPATKYGQAIVRGNSFVGWSGLGPVAMLLENILGFDFDAAANVISWRTTDPAPHGVENLHFNGGAVSLLRRNREITISAERPLTLKLAPSGGVFNLAAGVHRIGI